MERVVHAVETALEMLDELEERKNQHGARRESLESRRGLLAMQHTRALKEIEAYLKHELFESHKEYNYKMKIRRDDSPSKRNAGRKDAL